MSKVNIGIKTTEELHKNVHQLLDAAKELGQIKDKGEYFNITYPLFQDYLKRKELTQTGIGNNLAEVERSTTLIIKQFISMIETHNRIVQFNEVEYQEILKEKDMRVEALTSLLEKTENENIHLNNMVEKNALLSKKIQDLETKLYKAELKHEKEISKVKMTTFQSFLDDKLKEVN
jgi:hypothetical protein